jgi:Protein of unknown function (DUF1592)/Protein of unknown function (DUF1588)/Protein of unknown function (DUF1585)/Protein of unknown function (DUF1587)/Protein of unknown function (DUF1595)/Planctomycete cytochrome C
MKPSAPVSVMRHVAVGICLLSWASAGFGADSRGSTTPLSSMMEQYCTDCHNKDKKKGGIDFESIGTSDIAAQPQVWEKAIRKLRARQMPPAGKERPEEKTYTTVLARLESSLDAASAKHPNPGRTDTLRRLNRTEYQNAIRDLLALDIDAAALLPKDEGGHGFDNVTVGTLSPMLLDRYISAAQKISRLAVGAPRRPGGDTIRVRADVTQEWHVEGLPIGTRGGALIPYTFPEDAEYEIQIRLARDRNEEVEGLREEHDLELLLDREPVKSFKVSPPKDKNFELVDQHLKIRVPVTAGPHLLGVTFVKNPSSLLETKRQPYSAHFNMHRHPRITPAIYQVSINGPYAEKGPGDTPSRKRIFVSTPAKPEEEESCAKQILSTLMRRAYRRPVMDGDLEKPMNFYHEARRENGGGFDAGIEAALSSILVSPQFLFRVEQDPAGVAPGTPYRISDLELASRISFFLWSSIPDDELLDVAERGDLSKPEVLEKQVRRMLADPRSRSLVSNFGGQWLYLRNLDSFTPDLRLFPDFDDNLRQAFREETELFLESVLREDRSVLSLLKADYTFLNERLARHYEIPNVYGSRFRRVALDPNSKRGGLLRQGSVLAVTSYATRTSPVIRGKWVLENIVGAPPPPPLPDVPALKDNTISATLSVRERLAEHRSNAACASCHSLMDPIGFSLENFDAVGRWRTLEEGKPVDASGGFSDGSKFTGVAGLEDALLKRPEVFVGTLAEKLLTFALGRGLEYYDGPAIRKIVRDSRAADYRFSSIIVGLTKSAPFTMRKSS